MHQALNRKERVNKLAANNLKTLFTYVIAENIDT